MANQVSQKIIEKFRSLPKNRLSFGLRLLGGASVLFAILAIVWGLLSADAVIEDLLTAMGPVAPILFIFIQMAQTIIPFIPATLVIPIGLLIFGVSSGLFLSFLGLTIGSVINFRLARRFGRPFVEMFVSGKQLDKYTDWLEDDERFDRLFAFGMFFPLTPSDFLCYLAGLSDISFKKYLSITSLSKIFTLFLYAYGLTEILRFIFQFLID